MAQVKKAKTVASVGARHPFNNKKNHESLLQHIIARCDLAKEIQSQLTTRFADIDRELSGFLQLDTENRKLDRDNKAGIGSKWVTSKTQFIFPQLDEMVTFLMSVYAPEGDIYRAVSTPDRQDIAASFSLVMNKMAQRGQFYRHYARFLSNAMKYNLAAMLVEWDKIYGNKLSTTNDGRLNIKQNEIVWEGNMLRCLDMYNVLFDPAVDPVDCCQHGEFAALIERPTAFRVEQKVKNGELFNLDAILSQDYTNGCQTVKSYYTVPPCIRQNDSTQTKTDWVSTLSMGNVEEAGATVELIRYYGWINPSKFGLSTIDELQIWRITVANGTTICQTEWLNNAHGLLPIVFTMPIEDDLGLQEKSYAEQLIPSQIFANHLVNVHAEANRKSLYGLTVYDPTMIDMGQSNIGVCGRVPMKPGAAGQPIQNAIAHFNQAPDTDHTTADLARVLDMMQTILPTDILRQVADVDRATTYQAAATVQASNRRSLKLAKIIDDQAFTFVRHMQMYNIFQYLQEMEIMDEMGNVKVVNPSDFRDAKLEFDIGEGLKGMDRILVTSSIRDVIYAILQSQTALQQIDVVKLLDYWTSMMGDKTDLSRFKIQSPLLQMVYSMTPEQQNQVMALIQSSFQQQVTKEAQNNA